METVTEPTQELPSPTEVAEATATSQEAASLLPAAEEAAQPEPESEPPKESPFASVYDAYDLLEHPEVKPLIERQTRRAEERLAAEFEQKLQEETSVWEARETFKTLAGIQGRILEQLTDGNYEIPEKLIGKLESIAKTSEPAYQEHFKRVGAMSTFEVALAALKEGLDMRRQDELEDLRRQRGTTWSDLISRRVKMGAEREREIGRKEGMGEGRKAALNDIAARERGNPDRNPDMAPKGAGGGRPTIAQYTAATPEQRKKWREEGVEVQI